MTIYKCNQFNFNYHETYESWIGKITRQLYFWKFWKRIVISEYLQNGQIEPSIIGKESFIINIPRIYFYTVCSSLEDVSGWCLPVTMGLWIKLITEHHKRKTESSAKNKVESKSDEPKSTREKSESTETVTASDNKPENEPEVVGKKKPEREFEEPKDETAKEEAA